MSDDIFYILHDRTILANGLQIAILRHFLSPVNLPSLPLHPRDSQFLLPFTMPPLKHLLLRSFYVLHGPDFPLATRCLDMCLVVRLREMEVGKEHFRRVVSRR